ncbi:MAG: ABC transporter permease [Alphaproteobacteria bacterium]
MPKTLTGRWWLAFVLPYTLFLAVFLAVPLADILVLSVYRYSSSAIAIPDFTLRNFERLTNAYFGGLLLKTIKLAMLATAVCAVLGYPVAYYLARSSRRVMALGLFLLVVPIMISTVVRVFGWVVILGKNGTLSQLLQAVGFAAGVDILYTETAVMVGLVQLFLPFMVLPVMASIERIPRRLEEAARNLGANGWQVFRRTIFPMALPGFTSGCILVFSLTISAYVTPSLMGGTAGRMIGLEIYDQVLVSYNWPQASAIAIVLILLTVLVIFAGLLATMRRRGAALR